MANLANIIGDITTSAKLEKFFSSLKHADLPAGWQNDQGIVDAAGKLYREMGTDSPFFKAWGGSPEINYHGTTKNFDTFQSDGVRGGYHSRQPGTYFTTDNPEVAASYVREPSYFDFDKDKYDVGASIMPVFVNQQKPLKINARGLYWNEIPYKGNFVLTNDISDMIKQEGSRNKSAVIKNVFDEGRGKVASEPKKSTVSILTDPAQIKSRFNRGTFDPSDPNILRTAAPWLAGGGLAAGSVLGGGEAQAAPYSHADANNLDRTIERLSKSMPLNDMASGMIPRATQASVQPINNMGAWQQMEQQGRVTPDLPVPEAEWSPVDLATAPIGAAGKVGKLAAMALDAPINLAVNRLIDALSVGANTASNW